MKDLLKKIPFAKTIYEKILDTKTSFLIRRLETVEEVFTHHYNKKSWGDNETVSGSGSTLKYTKNIRKELSELFTALEIKSVFDAPCGDHNWFAKINLDKGIKYIGADIVDELVTTNQTKYGNENRRFIKSNIISDTPPNLDKRGLWICRDCLFHLSNDDVKEVLKKFSSSNFEYLLTSTHTNNMLNKQIISGEFRLLNLEKPPFNLPKADLYIKDYIEGSPVRYLGLWTRSRVAKSLAE